MSDLKELYKRFSFTPNNEDVFSLAFTHPSFNGMAGTSHHDYERLEFLGDSVIGMVVSELCFIHHPEMDQGELSVLKAQFIRTKSEAEYARRYGLHEFIVLGSSFKDDITSAHRVLEDVFESFVGALLIDQGLEFTYKTVREMFEKDVISAKIIVSDNPKSELQEAMQADHKESVTYRILEEDDSLSDIYSKVYQRAVEIDVDELKEDEDYLADLMSDYLGLDPDDEDFEYSDEDIWDMMESYWTRHVGYPEELDQI